MTSDAIIKRLITELPEFCWDEDLAGVYCGANFGIGYDVDDRESFCIPYTLLTQLKKSAVQYNHTKLIATLALVGCYEEIEIPCEDIDEKMFDAIISGIKDWKSEMDKLRHGEDKLQLVILHPDVDDYSANDILHATTILTEDENGFRLGLINAKDYDFGNKKFREVILDNSRDCFSIWRLAEPIAYLYHELYVQAIDFYPMIKDISDVYDTDYD